MIRFKWNYGRQLAVMLLAVIFLTIFVGIITPYRNLNERMSARRLVNIYNEMLESAKIKTPEDKLLANMGISEEDLNPINSGKIDLNSSNKLKEYDKVSMMEKMSYAAVDPFTAIAWALGFITQQPKTFHITNFDFEIYTEITLSDLSTIKSYYPKCRLKPGDKLYVNPEAFFGLFDGKGLLLRLIAEREWVCHVSIPVTRDTEVSRGKIVIYRGLKPQNAEELQPSEKVYEKEFQGNDFSFILPAKKNALAYSCSMYIERPTRANGFGYFRYYAKDGAEYARELSEKDKALAAMIYGKQLEQEKEEFTQYRTETLTLQGRQEPKSQSDPFVVPRMIVVQDRYGEVYRGPIQDTLNLKVSPEGFRLFKGKGEIDLSTNPSSQTGAYKKINKGQNNVVVIYPWRDQIYVKPESNVTQKFDGEVQIIAPYGTYGKVEMYINDSQKKAASINFQVETFCLDVIYAKTNQPVEKVRFVAYVHGKRFERCWYAGTPQQVPFYLMPNSFYSRTFSNHGAAPIVKRKFSNYYQVYSWLIGWGRAIYIRVGTSCLGLKSKFVLRNYNDLLRPNNRTYVVLGPQARTFTENGDQMTVINKVLGMSDSTYRKLRHGYRIRTREYYRVTVPKNRVGLVLGVDMDCGNIYLVYLPPGPYKPPTPGYFSPPKLPETPEVKLPTFEIFIGKSAMNIKRETIVPSPVAPLIGQASVRIDVKQSQLQTQNSTNTNVNNNNNTNTNINNNTNINDNTNVNNTTVDVNSTNNNINQQSRRPEEKVVAILYYIPPVTILEIESKCINTNTNNDVNTI